MDEKALKELHAEAMSEVQPETTEAPGGDGGQYAGNPAEEWAAMLKVGVLILTPALPFLPSIYTDEAVGNLAAAIVPVADKYEISAGGLFGKYGPEIGLALAAGPLVVRTVIEFRAMRAAQAEPREKEIRAEAEQPAEAAAA
jgi:hypothetical protein